MPITEPIDEDELEAELATMEQEKLDEDMLKTGTLPVTSPLNRLPNGPTGDSKSLVSSPLSLFHAPYNTPSLCLCLSPCSFSPPNDPSSVTFLPFYQFFQENNSANLLSPFSLCSSKATQSPSGGRGRRSRTREAAEGNGHVEIMNNASLVFLKLTP